MNASTSFSLQILGFDSDDVVPHNQTKRIIAKASVEGGARKDIEYTWNPVDGMDGCIYDVQCLEASELATVHNPKDTNPAGKSYPFNALLEYTCPRAMEFRVAAGEPTQPTVELRCQWNDTWTMDPTFFPVCECKFMMQLVLLI
jgi:hypothetical protein